MSEKSNQLLKLYEQKTEKFYDLIELDMKIMVLQKKLEPTLSKNQTKLLNSILQTFQERSKINSIHLLDFVISIIDK